VSVLGRVKALKTKIKNTEPSANLKRNMQMARRNQMACAILELVRKVVENVQRDSTAKNLKGKKPESRKESR